jgi:hypothetical protein
MKRFFAQKLKFSLSLFGVICISHGALASEYSHEVRKVMTNRRGYQEAWVRIQNPEAASNPKELPLEVSLPLCNKKSVKKLDQYCTTESGEVAIVTAIRGQVVSYEKIDLAAAEKFSKFAAYIRPTSFSRMPASAPEVEIKCEASCPQMDFTNTCLGTGSTKEKAYAELKTFIDEKKDAECKNCNLREVLCDGQFFKTERAPAKTLDDSLSN